MADSATLSPAFGVQRGIDALRAPNKASLLPGRAELAAAPAAARKAAQEFEAQFLAQYLGTIFDTVKSAEGFDGGAGEQAFKPFLVDEYAKAFAARGGIGVADAVLREILRYQSPANIPAAAHAASAGEPSPAGEGESPR